MSRSPTHRRPPESLLRSHWFYILVALLALLFASRNASAEVLSVTQLSGSSIAAEEATFAYHDEGGMMTVDQVADLPIAGPQGFEPLGSTAPFEQGEAVWWLQLEVLNPHNASSELVLVPGTSNAGRIDYYLRRNGAWEHSITGDRLPVHPENANVARVHALAFTLAAGEQTRILVRIESKRPLHIAPRLYSGHTFETSQRRAALWDGLLFGGLLVLAWGAAIIAVLAPSLHFAVMALLCLAVALYEATVRGYTKVYLWPHSIEWAERSPGVIGLGSLVLLLIFVLGISRSQRIYLPCRKALIALMAIMAVLTGTAALGFTSLVAQLAFPVLIAYGVTTFIAAALLVRNRTPGGRLIMLTGAFMLGHTILRLLTWTNSLPHFITELGADNPTTNPVIALLGLGLNVGVLTAWIILIGKQRKEARDELLAFKEKESERLKEQVERQTEVLNRSLVYAHEEGRRKVETLGYISHDLRAPLATIVGQVRLLAERADEADDELLKAIERNAAYQLSLIDEILEYAKNELKPLEIRPQPTALDEVLNDVIAHANNLSRKQGNRFDVYSRSPLPKHISIDATRLQQALLNLISNAAKFTRNGDIVLAAAAELQGEQATLSFSVTDSGAGIHASKHAQIFEAFEQIDARPGSVGLGLHIAQRIVANMGGSLTLKSEQGQGSQFSFTLPVAALSSETFELRAETSGDMSLAHQPDNHHASSSPITVPVPPVELRVDLARFARDGQLTDIEEWVQRQARLHPSYGAFFKRVETALKELDFEQIETMALSGAS